MHLSQRRVLQRWLASLQRGHQASDKRCSRPPTPTPADMVNIKLSYFNIQGPAEPVRLALVLAGIAFEDNRLDRDGMLTMREAGALTPKGCAGHQVPLLEVDGVPLLQSNAQAQYCAKLAGIYPSDPWLAAKCDECTQFIQQDIRERLIAPSMRAPDEETKVTMRKELHETKLPEKFAMLDAMLAETGYLVGGELSIADIHLYGAPTCSRAIRRMLTMPRPTHTGGVSPDCLPAFTRRRADWLSPPQCCATGSAWARSTASARR